MRRMAVLVASLALGASGVAAQHAGQFEGGAFGAYTHYDPAFGLSNKAGGGVRLGYLIGDVIGVEGDVLFQPEYSIVSGGATTTLEPLIASASLVLNVMNADRLMLYVLGGYSLLDFGTRAPYKFTDNAAHGGAGVRLFLSERIALRVEGRAIYTPSTQSTFGTANPRHYVGTLGLSVFHLGGGPKPPPVAAAPAPPPPPPAPPPPPEAAKCPTPPPGTPVDSLGCALPVVAVPPAPAPPPPEPPKCPTPPPGAPVDSLGCALPAPAIVTPPPPPPPAPPKCPPAPPGAPVDANGCLILFAPESVRVVAPGGPPRPTLVLRGVNFETGRSALTRDSYVVLDAVAASLLANPDIRIEIGGYTDSTGTKFGNMRLSQGRAARVRAYLASKGVLPARMIAKGYGATGYIAPNATAAGRAQNRRVELHKLP
jgi:outer membrane protein OmpA-like peptidoglycan-associated protein